MSIGEKLTSLMSERKTNASQLSQKIGVSKQTLYAIIKRNNTKVDLQILQKICDGLSVSLDYFLTESPVDLLDFEPTTEPLHSVSNSVRIKVFSSVHAGIPMEAQEDIIDWEDIPREWTTGNKAYFGVKVKGDCMTPKYREGDTVIILIQPDCENGQDCIVYVNGYDAELRRVIKEESAIVLQPLNPDYLTDRYYYNDPDHPVSIVGIVVEIRRKV